jgi:hypothetical protein
MLVTTGIVDIGITDLEILSVEHYSGEGCCGGKRNVKFQRSRVHKHNFEEILAKARTEQDKPKVLTHLLVGGQMIPYFVSRLICPLWSVTTRS